MIISIAERLRPFQHLAGTQALLPGTALRVTVYPSFLQFHDLLCAEPRLVGEMSLDIRGPVKDFTVEQDLERGCLLVWGLAASGYFRYRLSYDHGIQGRFEKGGNDFKVDVHTLSVPVVATSRLSLGNHKAQDWCMVKRRLDMKEIFPAWLRLGQLVPIKQSSGRGTAAFLSQCRDADRLQVVSSFQSLFSTGFEGILSPRLIDSQYQGFQLSAPEPADSPLVLLTEGARLIHSLFVQHEGDALSLLPALPPEFHCGRLVGYPWNGSVDLEWSKKLLRRMVLKAEKNASVHFNFQKQIRHFRLNGEYFAVNQPIRIEAGNVYSFDRFES